MIEITPALHLCAVVLKKIGLFFLIIFYYFSETSFGLFFGIQILLRFYSTFFDFVLGSLNHPNIISKIKFSQYL
jgi:hypothetical protein